MDQMYCIIGLTLVAFSLLYRYLTSTYVYWKDKSIPCLKGALPGLGHVAPMIFLRKQMSDLYRDFYNEMPDCSLFGFYNFRSPSLILRDPELVKCVMSKNFKDFSDNHFEIDKSMDPILAANPFFTNGERWKASRQQLTSAFTSGKLKYLLESIRVACGELDSYVNKKCREKTRPDTAELELKDLFSKYTAEVVASSAFGVDGDSFKSDSKDGPFRAVGRLVFEPNFAKGLIQTIVLFLPALSRVLKTRFMPKEVDQFFRKIVKDVIRHREERGIERPDFLQLMIEAKKNAKVDASLEQVFDDDIITVNAASFFLDGYETASIMLSFLVFQLATHPEVQDRLRQEVVNVVSKSGGLTYEAVQEMVYMDRVISESTRFYPVTGALLKRCTSDTELVGPDGITCNVSKGTFIVIPVAALHMDPEYWTKPEEFNPERFTEENKQRRHKFVHLPFGEGPRICPGQRVAMLIMKAAVATIIQKYRFELSSRTKIPIQLDPNYFLSTAVGGLWVKFTPL
ncbi:cytochrome P450 9e2-like [Diprion similis]|uniref:cytochrome P450 9e2-like n=1 Tax=Diprion similis TaxID=362088 RepID=UPI001EF836C7|nr:cytochrome P450 9e2-like [Diprion similis]